MKNLIFVLLILLLITANAFGQTVPVDREFAWQQSDYSEVDFWKLKWGSISGGPYDVGELVIDKVLLTEDQSSPIQLEYPDNALTTYYFVLAACKAGNYCSEDSNEVELTIDFIRPPGKPLNLRIRIVPAAP